MSQHSQHELSIIREEDFKEAITHIEQELNNRRHSGRFASFDGQELFYEYFLAENSIGTVVIVHGLSEFTKKFYELTWYFLSQQYNVMLYDQRGHGLSCRLTDEIPLIHVDRFEDYIDDLHVFIRDVVQPAVGQSPLYLFAHSMGGAVAALYLAKYTDTTVKKAVLSSPLIAPNLGKAPHWVMRTLANLEVIGIGAKSRSCQARDFNPDAKHTSRSADASRARFEYNLNWRRSTVYYQSTPQTTGWNREVLALKNKLLSRRITNNIRVPILMLIAENDTVVRSDVQHTFAKRCAACRSHVIPGAKHALFTSDAPVMTQLLTVTFDFYREP